MTFKPSLPLLAAAVAFSLSACTDDDVINYCNAHPDDPRCADLLNPAPEPTPPAPPITPDNATIDSVNGAAGAALKAGENNTVRFTIYDDGKPLSGKRAVDVSIIQNNGNVAGAFSNGQQKVATSINNGSGSFVLKPSAGGKITVRMTVTETGDFFTRHLNVNAAATPVNPNPSGDPCANVGAPGKMNSTQPVTQVEKCAILKAHNDARDAEKAGLPHLKWNDKLAEIAFAYSKQCKWQHSQNGYGENLMMGTAGGFTVADAVNAWVGEKKNYNGQPIGQGNFGSYGHYTQVVWKATTEVGCGYAKCGGNVIMTCNYNPAGNITGGKPY